MNGDIPNPVRDVINGPEADSSTISPMKEIFNALRENGDGNNGEGGIMDNVVGGIKKWLSENQENPFAKFALALFGKTGEATKELAKEVEQNGNNTTFEGIQGSFDKFSGILDKYTEKYSIPDGMLAHLINKEGSNWNTGVKAKGSSGFGLGQHIEDTWIFVRNTILKRDGYDIGPHGSTSPEAQIYATAEYLSQMKKKGTWEEAMAYYNTGPGIKNISSAQALENARINPAISNLIPGVTVKKGEILAGEEFINPSTYFKAAVAYYNDKQYETVTSNFA